MTTKRYRVAIIGRTGHGDYGHYFDTMWNYVAGAEVVALADDDEAGRAVAGERVHAPRTYADYREMLERERPEIVAVASRWCDCHFEMISACAAIGAHVIAEKPLVPTIEEADKLAAICEKAGVKVAVGHHVRYTPELRTALQMVSDGVIGDVLEVRARCKEDHRGGAEDYSLLGSHMVDAFRAFLGDARWCFARVTTEGEPLQARHVQHGNEGIGLAGGDRIDAVYGFDAVPVAHLSSHRNAATSPSRFGVRLHGTRGALALEPGTSALLSHTTDPGWGRDGRPWQPLPAPPDAAAQAAPDGNWLLRADLRMAADLFDAIENDRQPLCSLYDGRAAWEMIMAVYASQLAGAPVALPLANRAHPLAKLAPAS